MAAENFILSQNETYDNRALNFALSFVPIQNIENVENLK